MQKVFQFFCTNAKIVSYFSTKCEKFIIFLTRREKCFTLFNNMRKVIHYYLTRCEKCFTFLTRCEKCFTFFPRNAKSVSFFFYKVLKVCTRCKNHSVTFYLCTVFWCFSEYVFKNCSSFLTNVQFRSFKLGSNCFSMIYTEPLICSHK